MFDASSTTPALARATDGSRWVVKFAGAGPGPAGLLTELIGTRAAAALGLTVPEAHPIWLPSGFPWQVGTDEFDEMIQRSFGWNLALAFVEGSRLATADDLFTQPEDVRARLTTVDAVLHNVDRTRRNPNLLIAPDGTMVAIDHGSCLFLSRALRGHRAAPSLPANHILAPRSVVGRTAPHRWADHFADAPQDWIVAAGTTRDALANALQSIPDAATPG